MSIAKIKSKSKVIKKIIKKFRFIVNHNPVGIYMFKVNNRNTRIRCEICSKLTIFHALF